jgi:hypothetical protein
MKTLKKKFLIAVLFFIPTAYILQAQVNVDQNQSVGVGTATPHSSAKLEISNGTAQPSKGFLMPSISYTDLFDPNPNPNKIQNPATGLQVFVTDNLESRKGVYYYNGQIWVRLGIGDTEYLEIPASAFAFQEYPTVAEAQIYVNANFTAAQKLSSSAYTNLTRVGVPLTNAQSPSILWEIKNNVVRMVTDIVRPNIEVQVDPVNGNDNRPYHEYLTGIPTSGIHPKPFRTATAAINFLKTTSFYYATIKVVNSSPSNKAILDNCFISNIFLTIVGVSATSQAYISIPNYFAIETSRLNFNNVVLNFETNGTIYFNHSYIRFGYGNQNRVILPSGAGKVGFVLTNSTLDAFLTIFEMTANNNNICSTGGGFNHFAAQAPYVNLNGFSNLTIFQHTTTVHGNSSGYRNIRLGNPNAASGNFVTSGQVFTGQYSNLEIEFSGTKYYRADIGNTSMNLKDSNLTPSGGGNPSNLRIMEVPTFESELGATNGNLLVGDVYKTTIGDLRIKTNTAVDNVEVNLYANPVTGVDNALAEQYLLNTQDPNFKKFKTLTELLSYANKLPHSTINIFIDGSTVTTPLVLGPVVVNNKLLVFKSNGNFIEINASSGLGFRYCLVNFGTQTFTQNTGSLNLTACNVATFGSAMNLNGIGRIFDLRGTHFSMMNTTVNFNQSGQNFILTGAGSSSANNSFTLLQDNIWNWTGFENCGIIDVSSTVGSSKSYLIMKGNNTNSSGLNIGGAALVSTFQTPQLAKWNESYKNVAITSDALKPIRLTNIQTYANETEAINGGLLSGELYKTSTGELRIKL